MSLSPTAAVVSSCALCQTELPPEGAAVVNGNAVCASCAAQVEAELQAEQTVGARMPLAFAGGAAGALVGALVWAGIVVATDYAIGYIAVLVGFLAGQGVKLGAGKGRGQSLQIMAAGLAFGGLAVSKFFIFSHVFQREMEKLGQPVGYLSQVTVNAFLGSLGEMLSPFDLLWVFLALTAAWRVPAASKVAIR